MVVLGTARAFWLGVLYAANVPVVVPRLSYVPSFHASINNAICFLASAVRMHDDELQIKASVSGHLGNGGSA